MIFAGFLRIKLEYKNKSREKKKAYIYIVGIKDFRKKTVNLINKR